MAKKTKKPQLPPELEETPSIFDLVALEMKKPLNERRRPDGEALKHTKELFKMWCVLPDTFKGAPGRITELLGVKDEITVRLLGISTMSAFAEEFDVGVGSLFRWKREIESSNDYMDDVKRAFKPLTKNVMAALYRKMLDEGDGPRFMAWMKVVEGWREQLGIEHSGNVGDGLSPEERKELMDLVAKNT